MFELKLQDCRLPGCWYLVEYIVSIKKYVGGIQCFSSSIDNLKYCHQDYNCLILNIYPRCQGNVGLGVTFSMAATPLLQCFFFCLFDILGMSVYGYLKLHFWLKIETTCINREMLSLVCWLLMAGEACYLCGISWLVCKKRWWCGTAVNVENYTEDFKVLSIIFRRLREYMSNINLMLHLLK